jgi:hypothetical protein
MTMTTAARIALPLLIGTVLALGLVVFAGGRSEPRDPLRLETAGPAGGRARFELGSAPPRTMTPTPMQLELTTADGAPLTGAEVECDLTMPAMSMPVNRPQLRESTPGVYACEAVFTMAGDWEATFDIRLPDGEHRRLVFALGEATLR